MEWISWVAMFLTGLVGVTLNRAVNELQKLPELKDIKMVVGMELHARTLQHPVSSSIENSRTMAWATTVLLAISNFWGFL